MVGVLALGCSSRSAPPSAVTPESTPESASESTSERPAAFVLYTAEQTVVLPLDGSGVHRGRGLWIQDDRAPHRPVVTHHQHQSMTAAAQVEFPVPPPEDTLEGELYEPCVQSADNTQSVN